jgi:hypothetical protein
MSDKSSTSCPVLPNGLNRPVCTSAVTALGVGIGTYVSLRRSDLKVLGGWDLQKNKYFVPGISIAVATMVAASAGLISHMLSKRN